MRQPSLTQIRASAPRAVPSMCYNVAVGQPRVKNGPQKSGSAVLVLVCAVATKPQLWSMLRDRAALGRWTRCPVADRKREQISGRSRVGVSKLAASINLKIDRAGNLVGFA